MREQVTLSLSSGEVFQGQLIGASLHSSGELVFTTGLVGYSESLSDPSYFGQILVFAYPLIGNYGIPALPSAQTLATQNANSPLALTRGFESSRVHAAAVILSSDSQQAYHWTSTQSIDQWLKDQQVPGLVGLDTRHLVHLIRKNPGLLGRVSPATASSQRVVGGIPFGAASLTAANGNTPFFDPNQQAIIQAVSTRERLKIGKGQNKIAVFDFGVKWNILRSLCDLGCELELLPWDTDPSSVDCDGWLLSNGPGNPVHTGPVLSNLQKLLQQDRPILGICLGHQLLCLAAGCQTRKMAYGHRSHNQAVQVVGSEKAYITSQNHGFEVTEEGFPEGWQVWFRNVNDHSIEGVRHRVKPFASVQFHPESAGGPRDTAWVLDEFVAEVKRYAYHK